MTSFFIVAAVVDSVFFGTTTVKIFASVNKIVLTSLDIFQQLFRMIEFCMAVRSAHRWSIDIFEH